MIMFYKLPYLYDNYSVIHGRFLNLDVNNNNNNNSNNTGHVYSAESHRQGWARRAALQGQQ